MKRIYTADEMKRAEQSVVDRGSSFEQLMESAGQGVAKDLLKRIADGKLERPQSVLILCGKGNNAGDGLVIARVLAEHEMAVNLMFLMGSELSELAQLNLERLEPLDINIIDDKNKLLDKSTDWIIDAVFGTGFVGLLPDNIADTMELVNKAEAYRIALDVPTGLNCDSGELAKNTFKADLTYTFAAYKPAHCMDNSKTRCGEIICIDIGI